jgi:hypothetical protein
LFGEFDHFGADIDGKDSGAVLDEPFGIDARATAGVEDLFAFDGWEEGEGGGAFDVGVVGGCVDYSSVFFSEGFVGVKGDGFVVLFFGQGVPPRSGILWVVLFRLFF